MYYYPTSTKAIRTQWYIWNELFRLRWTKWKRKNERVEGLSGILADHSWLDTCYDLDLAPLVQWKFD